MSFNSCYDEEIEFSAHVETEELASPDVTLSQAELMTIENSIRDEEAKAQTLPCNIIDAISLEELAEIISVRTKTKPKIEKLDFRQGVVLKTYYGVIEFTLSSSDRANDHTASDISVICRHHLYHPCKDFLNNISTRLSASTIFTMNDSIYMKTMVFLSGGVSGSNILTQIVRFCEDAEYVHKKVIEIAHS